MINKPGSRRNFLKGGLVIAGGVGLGLAAWNRFGTKGAMPSIHPGLGPLSPVRDETTGLPLLKLPEGFRYHTFSWADQIMSDGFPSPGSADGMGAISQEKNLVTLVRNHELRGSSGAFGEAERAWDVVGGGTTNLVFDTNSEKLAESFVSLNGTLNNCGGGTTPWGTWLSCEEAVYDPESAHFGIELRQRHWDIDHAENLHGYVFEVGAEPVKDAEPLWDMGQFTHEAATVDPGTGTVYMTEDRSPHAGFYRFIPKVPGQLSQGGKLQMLKVEGFEELIRDVKLFSPMATSWVDIPEPRRGNNPGTHDGKGVVSQGLENGATALKALEGCIWSEGNVYFTSKNGGDAESGQVFRLDLINSTIELIYEAPAKGGFSGPDNIVTSPRGGLIICEDRGGGDLSAQYLASLNSTGDLYAFAQVNPLLSGTQFGFELESTMLTSEWAGATFSPDGQWLFVNIYLPGFTCAITGPWIDGVI